MPHMQSETDRPTPTKGTNTMSDKINDGGPAFPSEGEGHNNPKYHSPGMTLRDWFAGQALAGILADPAGKGYFKEIAVDCYRFADALLAAREVKP